MTSCRKRLDQFLAEEGLSDSTEEARKDILAGWVRVNGETVRSSSIKVTGTENITVSRPRGRFVSRGGEKLQKALDTFGINVKGLVCTDLGASTGGFTDCLLQAGAAKVYSVDVGYGQLDFSLRKNPAVVVMDRSNVRNLEKEQFQDRTDFISMDLSFISVTKVIDHVKNLFPGADGVMLLKPQFEALDGEHEKGVVRNLDDHIRILKRVLDTLAGTGICVLGLCFSPIKGPAGNIEFLVHFSFDEKKQGIKDFTEAAVSSASMAHKALD